MSTHMVHKLQSLVEMDLALSVHSMERVELIYRAWQLSTTDSAGPFEIVLARETNIK